jgi:hypothetical protein
MSYQQPFLGKLISTLVTLKVFDIAMGGSLVKNKLPLVAKS